MSAIPEVSTYELFKAGPLEANANTLLQKSKAFQTQAPDGTTLILLRDEAGGAHSYVSFPASKHASASMAFKLGDAVAAKAQYVEEGLSLADVEQVSELSIQKLPDVGQSTQAGAEFGTVVQSMVGFLAAGEWVAISLRTPTKAERKSNKLWLAHRGIATHHSFETGAVIASIYAGSSDAMRTGDLVRHLTSTLPGFDVIADARRPSKFDGSLPFVVAALIGAGTTIGMPLLLREVPTLGVEVPQLLNVPWTALGVLVAVAAIAVLIGRLAGRLPSSWRTLQRLLGQGLAPESPTLTGTPKRPAKESRTLTKDHDGNPVEKIRPEFAGEYPVHPHAAFLGPHLPLALVAPHAGSAFSGGATGDRIAPVELRRNIGPVIGSDRDGVVHLSSEDAWAGMFVTGLAGSGKSRLLEAQWGWFLSRRLQSKVRRSMIAFDTKGDGVSAAAYARWAAKFEAPVEAVSIADRNASDGIAFFPEPGGFITAHDYARDVVDTLKAVYGVDSIGPRSSPSLIAVFEAGSLLARSGTGTVPEVFTEALSRYRGRTPFWYANLLIGNGDDQDAKEIAGLIQDAAQAHPEHAELVSAADHLGPTYGGGVTPSQRKNLFDAPRSKVEPLMTLEHWWARPNQRTWDELLEADANVIIDFGPSASGHALDDRAREQMAALAMHTMWKAIRRTCIGWGLEDRRVAVFEGEVKHLAAHSGDVLSWFRNDGRSFGVEPFFATQFPEQLEDTVRKTMLGYGTRIVLRQEDASVIRDLVASLVIDGSAWEPEDVANLPKYTAIVKTTLDKEAMRAFTLKIPDFEAMSVAEFSALHSSEQGASA